MIDPNKMLSAFEACDARLQESRNERDALAAKLSRLIDAALQAREALDDADASTRKMLDAIHAVDAAVAEARK